MPTYLLYFQEFTFCTVDSHSLLKGGMIYVYLFLYSFRQLAFCNLSPFHISSWRVFLLCCFSQWTIPLIFFLELVNSYSWELEHTVEQRDSTLTLSHRFQKFIFQLQNRSSEVETGDGVLVV